MPVLLRVANNTVPSGNQFSNSSTENIFADVVPQPANNDSLSNAGRAIRIKAFGYISSKASGPGTLTFKIKWGATTLVASTAIALPASLVNAAFMIDAVVIICTTGASGKLSAQGMVFLDNAGAAMTAGMVNAGTVATGQITINTQSGVDLGVSATFSLADVGNIVTLTQLIVDDLT